MGSLDGKIALVTGASSGIGLVAAVKLAQMGAEVVMVARNPERGKEPLEQVKMRSGSQRVSLLCADFASQKQTRQLAADFRAKHDALHILVNNAGSVSDKRVLTEDGIEQTFAVNHLGPFLLTLLLLDVIEKSAPARIVNVASIGHRRGDMDFEDLGYERGYTIMKAYQRSKLGNVLFTQELARRLEGKGVTVNALHPGVVATPIWSRAPWFAKPILAVGKLFMISPEQGGDRIVQLASAPELEGVTGAYFEDGKKVWPSRRSQEPELAKRLWDESARLVGL